MISWSLYEKIIPKLYFQNCRINRKTRQFSKRKKARNSYLLKKDLDKVVFELYDLRE